MTTSELHHWLNFHEVPQEDCQIIERESYLQDIPWDNIVQWFSGFLQCENGRMGACDQFNVFEEKERCQ